MPTPIYMSINDTGFNRANAEDDTFEFSTSEGNGDSANSDLNFFVWRDATVEPNSDEPGLPGVTIYLDLNNNGSLDTTTSTFDADFII